MSELAFEYKLTSVQEVGAAPPITAPEEAVEYWRKVIEERCWFQPNREHVVALHLNVRSMATGHHLVGIGTLSECTAHPRDIFGPALCAPAHTIVLMHNHPSGDPAPSRADHELTKLVRNGGEFLRVELVDHVIVGAGENYFSFREAGLI